MSAATQRQLQHFLVPVGTHKTKCKGSDCSSRFYWVQSANGRMIPVDCDSCKCGDCAHPVDSAPLLGELDAKDGCGVHHSMVCVSADDFRGRR